MTPLEIETPEKRFPLQDKEADFSSFICVNTTSGPNGEKSPEVIADTVRRMKIACDFFDLIPAIHVDDAKMELFSDYSQLEKRIHDADNLKIHFCRRQDLFIDPEEL